MSVSAWKNLSLRDPAGQLFDYGGRLFRSVDSEYESVLTCLEQGKFWSDLTARGSLIEFNRLGFDEIPDEKPGLWIEHPRCWFPSYPTEWSPHMVSSAWTGYEASVSAQEIQQKEQFLLSSFETVKPARLLDLGCNDGRYSLLAAERGIETVATDRDGAVLGKLWRSARDKKLPLLPLSLDLARPSPATGWANGETLSFQERAEGKFDLVVAYAILHHLWVAEGIAMVATLQWLHSLKAPWLAVEHVAPEDPRVEQLRRGRRLPDLSRGRFEKETLALGFAIRSRLALSGGTRTLYLLNRTR